MLHIGRICDTTLINDVVIIVDPELKDRSLDLIVILNTLAQIRCLLDLLSIILLALKIEINISLIERLVNHSHEAIAYVGIFDVDIDVVDGPKRGSSLFV